MKYATLLALLAISAPAWAQHSGHPQPGTNRAPAIELSQALKDAHALLRKVERALSPYDEKALAEAAERYETALDAIAAASGASAKDLNRAARTLESHIEKLRLLEEAPEPARETVGRLLDAATVALDSVRAEIDGLSGAGLRRAGRRP